MAHWEARNQPKRRRGRGGAGHPRRSGGHAPARGEQGGNHRDTVPPVPIEAHIFPA